MEHHLSRETLNYANLVHTAAPTADESLDLIVPDAQPDILRIISAEPEIFVRSKDAENGKATVSGTVRVNIIYAPESGDGARKLAVEVPYSLSTSDANLTSASRVVARVGVDSADAVIVNPRKLTARVNVVGELRCFNDESVEVPTAEGLGDADDIETLPYSAELNLPTDVREKIFTVNDDVALPASNAPLSELLSSKATIAPEETKVVGSKLIFKGSAYTDLLYLTENGDTASAAVKSEFSQILELELADAESEFEVIPLVTASYVDPITGGDYAEKRVAIEIHAVGQVVAT
ncbi:MAG: DUF3794 domain-containing protein, partial [Oscillospiraceae bacterium]|nr:DUF3794 domain-containing protein [Oscillospiraceae bacterium]